MNIEKNYLYALRFFTFWMVFLIVFHHYTYKYVNLLYLSYVTLICGLYLSFINPRRFVFYFEGVRYEYTGVQKFIIVDLIFHILVFYFVYRRYASYYTSNYDMRLLVSFIIVIIYALFNNIKKIYGISFIELFSVFCISTILYFILF
jgi:hypothetical protein